MKLTNQKTKANPYASLIILMIAMYIIWPYLRDTLNDIRPYDPQEQGQIDNTPKPDVSLEGTRLIVISESKDRPVREISLLDNAEFWDDYLKSKSMGFLIIDPDDETHESEIEIYNQRAKERGITGSYIAHVKGTNLINMIAMPDNVGVIKKMINGEL